MIEKVIEFNQQILGITQRYVDQQSIEEFGLTFVQLDEELNELSEARNNSNLVEQIDALIDLIYFAQGALYKMGINAKMYSAIFNAVHDCNMTKKKGKSHRENHGETDAVKPEYWRPPNERIMSIICSENEDYNN